MESIPVCCFSVFWNIGGNNEIVLGHHLDTEKEQKRQDWKAGCICCIFTVFLNNRAFTSAVLSVTFWGMTQSVAGDCSRSRLTDRWVSASLCLANTDGTVCKCGRPEGGQRRDVFIHIQVMSWVEWKESILELKTELMEEEKMWVRGRDPVTGLGWKKELFIRHWGRDWGGTCYRREMENRHG